MEKILKEDFIKWAEECNWLLINEVAIPTGRKATYICPSGTIVFPVYDLNGNLDNIGYMMPAVPVMAAPMGRSPLDFRGGTHIPPSHP